MAKVTELHCAARNGDIKQLESILANGTKMEDINVVDQHQRTPLHLAAFFGHALVVEKLLEHNANIQCEAMDGFLPLHFAAQGGHLEVMRRLIEKIRENRGIAAVVRHVNRVVRKGKKSALHLAVLKGHKDCARFLVKKGANTDLKTSQGQTALDLCKSEEFRRALSDDAVVVHEAESEPPAKRRATADIHGCTTILDSNSVVNAIHSDAGTNSAHFSTKVEAPIIASLPMSGLPLEPLANVMVRQGVLVFGPFALDRIKLEAVGAARSYPVGVAALADVHWKFENKGTQILPNRLVWGIMSHELRTLPGEHRLHITMQQSDYKFLLYTCLSDEGRLLPKKDRCNACGLTILAETADGCLVFAKGQPEFAQQDKRSWHTIPESHTLDSIDLNGSLRKATGGANYPIDPSVLAAAQLLALLDVDEVSPQGHQHEFVFGIRLAASAAEVHQAYMNSSMEDNSLVFVKLPGNLPMALGCEVVASAMQYPIVSFDEFIAEGSGGCSCAAVPRQALLVLRELRLAATANTSCLASSTEALAKA